MDDELSDLVGGLSHGGFDVLLELIGPEVVLGVFQFMEKDLRLEQNIRQSLAKDVIYGLTLIVKQHFGGLIPCVNPF